MARKDTLAKSDQWRILIIGLGFLAMSYLLDSIINASLTGESLYRQILSPGSGVVAARLTLSSMLLLFIAYVLNLLLKRRRLAEALVKYQAGMDASVDGIAILDNTHECIYLNSSHTLLHGYGSHTELLGKPWRLFYGDDEIRRFEEEIFPVIANKGEWRGEAVGRKRDGSGFPQEISLTRMDGKGIVCIVRDITGQKNFERELERKALELSASNRELEAFRFAFP